jgi:hypothetical protein
MGTHLEVLKFNMVTGSDEFFKSIYFFSILEVLIFMHSKGAGIAFGALFLNFLRRKRSRVLSVKSNSSWRALLSEKSQSSVTQKKTLQPCA